MSEHEFLNDDDARIEASLKSLRLRPAEIDAGQLLFAAGRESVLREQRTRLWRWQLSTAALAACSCLLAITLWRVPQTTGPAGETVVAQEHPAAADGGRDAVAPKAEEELFPEQTIAKDDVVPNEQEQSLVHTIPAMDPEIGERYPYFYLRHQVLTRGIEAWPVRESGSSESREPLTASPDQIRKMLESELGIDVPGSGA